ncbi:unnamed protein product [Caenorhabditis bovis]|uniref:Carboxylesterase type B domain-containing protein n=1 Tax=Caenorhabditis bovis TaxID=2654633 RepID=A0A8S1EP28_9PELO|nr:unnamed protein product [Caenorhabditis bovis]
MQHSFIRLLASHILLLGSLAQQTTNNYVSVSCSQGVVQGRQVDYGNDRSQLYCGSGNVFTGIPYAQPPVNDLRFQPPQPITSFNSPMHDATYFRPKCPQTNANGPTNEDCLYLNIYTPQVGNTTANMAVLVLIDGSNGFANGGCDESQVKGIVSNLVQREIVVVTLQYRLGALGFFTTYTGVVQSNLGMLDQVQAMKWIKSEITNFGGDPNKITVAGHDDGACAVSAHTLSPMSQDLFQQAIIQSGSIYSCYNNLPVVPAAQTSMYDDPSAHYGNANYGMPTTTSSTSAYDAPNAQFDDPNVQLADTLCNISPEQWRSGQIQNIQNCLKNYTVDFFVNQSPTGQTSTWMIVRDNQFLPDSVENLQARRPNIPIIIGTVQDENADYAFKLINTGKSDDPNNLDNWIFDFARKNKLNSAETDQVANIVSQNYGGQVQYDAGSHLQGYQTNTGYQPNSGYQYQAQPTTGYQQNAQYNNNAPQAQTQGYQTQQIFGQAIQYQSTYQGGGQQMQSQPVYDQGGRQQQQYNQGSQSAYQGGVYQNQQPQPVYQNQQPASTPPTYQYQQPTATQPAYLQNQGSQQVQRDQPSGSGVSDYTQLKKITQIASDQSTSLTTTEIQSFMQNGDRHVRIYQFTHVSEVGRQTVPNTGDAWKPVFKGQDMFFITMSETIWSNCNYTSQDRQVADTMGQQWADFVKTGQVNNWSPTNQQNYNYCNFNAQPVQQQQYAQQARQVFQEQVNPICVQAQNNYAAQNNLTVPYSPSTPLVSPSRTPGTAQVQYDSNPNGQNFHITFQVNSFPFNG